MTAEEWVQSISPDSLTKKFKELYGIDIDFEFDYDYDDNDEASTLCIDTPNLVDKNPLLKILFIEDFSIMMNLETNLDEDNNYFAVGYISVYIEYDIDEDNSNSGIIDLGPISYNDKDGWQIEKVYLPKDLIDNFNNEEE